MSDVTRLLAEISPLGRDGATGGVVRPGFSRVETELREWFEAEAEARGLDVHRDRNGIVWAWATPPGPDAVVTGSHLDSVPGGGEFDGPLGVASALAAVDLLRERGVLPPRGASPVPHESASAPHAGRPLAIAVFPEEEGSSFGLACLGSRLLTGAIGRDAALGLSDTQGRTLAETLPRLGLDPAHIGRDEESLGRIGDFVELHVEQGRGLIDLGEPVGIGTEIIGHGRWRLSFTGQGNHAGTTPMTDRRDPVVAGSRLIAEIPELAAAHPGAVATVGRTLITPGGTNVIASRFEVLLDVRHAEDSTVARLVEDITMAARVSAAREGCEAGVRQESLSPTARFSPELRTGLQGVLPQAPLLPTGAGHDAGILSSRVRSGMLFVRNPSGVSHAPEEHVEDADAHAGAVALADVLEHLLHRGPRNGAHGTSEGPTAEPGPVVWPGTGAEGTTGAGAAGGSIGATGGEGGGCGIEAGGTP